MAKDLVLNIIMNATDKASAAFKRLRDGGNVLAQSLNKAEAELARLDKAQAQLMKRSSLNKEINANSKAMMQNRMEAGKLYQEIEKAGKASKTHEAALKRLSAEHDKLARRQEKNREEVRKLDKSLTNAGISAKTFGHAQEQLNRKHAAAARAVEKQRAAYEKMDKATRRLHAAPMVAAGFEAARMYLGSKAAAVGRTLQAPVRAYAQSETASADLRAAMMKSDGSVAAEFKQINDLAVKLGDRLPGTTADFQNLMTMLMRQGISAKAVLGGTGEAAALLSVQLKKSPEAAAEMAAKLQDATRGTEKEMVAIMDQVQRLYYLGVDDSNILGAFSTVAPALDLMKVSGEQAMKTMGPLIAMLDQSGMTGEKAGNALRKVFDRSLSVDKFEKLKKLTGVSLDFTDGKGNFAGLDKAFDELAKLKNLTDVQLKQVLGKVWGDDAETIGALTTMIRKGKEGYEEYARKMQAQASLNQRVNDQLNTLTNLWDAASGTFTNFLAKMGESVAPELKSLTRWIAGINEKLSAWATANPKTAATLMKLAAGIGVVLAGLSAAAAVAAALVMPFAAINYAITALRFGQAIAGIGKLLGVLKMLGSAVVWLGRLFLMNPIGLAITVIAGALYLLWANWDKVKSAVITGWERIKAVLRANPMLAAFMGPVGWLAALFANWDRVKSALIAGWEWIKKAFGGQNPIAAALHAAANPIGALIANFDRLKNAAVGAWEWIKKTTGIGTPAKAAETAVKAPTAKPGGFSAGGYTGNGGVHEAAGIVHKGEVVFSQRDVARFGGWQAVEAIRRGGAGLLAGFADKLGFSDGNTPRRATVPSAPRGGFAAAGASFGGDTVTIHIHAAPGMGEAGIADKIRRILDERDAAKRRRANSSYRDRD